MTKFRWAEIEQRHASGDISHTMSLLELLDDDKVQFWASILLYPTPEYKFEFCAFNSKRILKQCKPDAQNVDEAKRVIMNFLRRQKVIKKDDVIQYA